MRYSIITLGCKVNQAESGGMGELLRHRGHKAAATGETPELLIVNTCAVTATAGQKSRAAIRRLAKRYPEAVLGVCGCLSQTEKLDLPGVALYGGSGGKEGFVRRLEELAANPAGNAAADKHPAPRTAAALPPVFEALPDALPEGRTRLFLKIQDGCENRCTYCRVPDARGPARSRPEEDILRAVERAAADGIPELVLCGVEIASYQPSLPGLTERVCRLAPHLRVRLGSLYPTLPDEDFCARLSACPNLCPHFHLSLQSADSGVLKRMNRRYGTEELEALFRRLRRHWDRPAISCDILCGFPGETEAEFHKTLRFLEEQRPSRLHVFPYSRRDGTPAAAAPEQVPDKVKGERAARLRALDEELRAEFAAAWLGKTEAVPLEQRTGGLWRGHTTRYIPVGLSEDGDLQGKTLSLRLVRPLPEGFAAGLEGEIVGKKENACEHR